MRLLPLLPRFKLLAWALRARCVLALARAITCMRRVCPEADLANMKTAALEPAPFSWIVPFPADLTPI